MYYISRIDESRRVYVTDTEDGVEEYVSRNDLEKLFRSGVEIAGLSGEIGRQGKVWLRVRVSLPPTRFKASMLMFSGLDVDVTPDGVLRSIAVRGDYDINKRIVFGDFCTQVASAAVPGDEQISVTFVFDDRITNVSPKWVNLYVRYKVDVEKLTNEDVLANVYVSQCKSFDNIYDPDEERRIKFIQLACIMTGTHFEDTVYTKQLEESPFYDDFILSKCKKTLLRGIPRNTEEFSFKNDRAKRIDVECQLRWFRKVYNLAGSYEYDESDTYHMVSITKKVGIPKARLALNYIMCGGKDEDIHRAAVNVLKGIAKLYGFEFPSRVYYVRK